MTEKHTLYLAEHQEAPDDLIASYSRISGERERVFGGVLGAGKRGGGVVLGLQSR